MPDDRTTPYGEPPSPPERVRRPDRIVTYARGGGRQLAIGIVAAFVLMVAIELLFYEVLSDRGSFMGNVARGLVKALLPIGMLLFLVRRKR